MVLDSLTQIWVSNLLKLQIGKHMTHSVVWRPCVLHQQPSWLLKSAPVNRSDCFTHRKKSIWAREEILQYKDRTDYMYFWIQFRFQDPLWYLYSNPYVANCWPKVRVTLFIRKSDCGLYDDFDLHFCFYVTYFCRLDQKFLGILYLYRTRD